MLATASALGASRVARRPRVLLALLLCLPLLGEVWGRCEVDAPQPSGASAVFECGVGGMDGPPPVPALALVVPPAPQWRWLWSEPLVGGRLPHWVPLHPLARPRAPPTLPA